VKNRWTQRNAAPPAVHAALVELFAAATAALVPARLIPRVRGPIRRLGPQILVVGAGKGAAGLAAAVERALGSAVIGGLVIVPPGHEQPLDRVAIAIGGHPLPDRRSLRATARLLGVLTRHPGVPVLVLLTGGASSLLAAPAAGLTLDDERRATDLLLASGARIDEMNAVRKHVSAVKGGRLAERLAGRAALGLVISDVPGDDLSVVGSGPTVADPTTFADARRVLVAYGLQDRISPRVRRHFALGMAGAIAETPKPGAAIFRGRPTLLLASNATARAAAAAYARQRYPRVVNVPFLITGPTAAAALEFAKRIRRWRSRASGVLPVVLVAGGETTVTLGRTRGRGGRNQEFALVVARVLAGERGWALLSAGSDGIDGPTDAAGAFVDGATTAHAARAGWGVEDALARHDVFPLLDAIGALYRPGPTGTNVADLKLALVWRGRGWRLPSGVPRTENPVRRAKCCPDQDRTAPRAIAGGRSRVPYDKRGAS